MAWRSNFSLLCTRYHLRANLHCSSAQDCRACIFTFSACFLSFRPLGMNFMMPQSLFGLLLWLWLLLYEKYDEFGDAVQPKTIVLLPVPLLAMRDSDNKRSRNWREEAIYRGEQNPERKRNCQTMSEIVYFSIIFTLISITFGVENVESESIKIHSWCLCGGERPTDARDRRRNKSKSRKQGDQTADRKMKKTENIENQRARNSVDGWFMCRWKIVWQFDVAIYLPWCRKEMAPR